MNGAILAKALSANRYLFFDIECANCFDGIAKMCEISFVIVDKRFNILAEKEITINPQAWFKLTGRRFREDCHLRYEENNYSKYRKSPLFYDVADIIRTFFNTPDCITVGYAVKEDFRDLLDAHKRYEMSKPHYDGIDIQPISKAVLGLEKALSLEKLARELCSEEELEGLHPHWSLHDAKMTMLCFKHLCEKAGGIAAALASGGESCLVDSAIQPQSHNAAQTSGKYTHKRMVKAFHDFEATLSEKDLAKLDDQKYVGKRFAFSGAVQELDNVIVIAKSLMAKGYCLSPNTGKSDVIICLNEKDIDYISSKLRYGGIRFIEVGKVDQEMK